MCVDFSRILLTERRASPHDMANALKVLRTLLNTQHTNKHYIVQQAYIVKSHQPLIPVTMYHEFLDTYGKFEWCGVVWCGVR